MALINAHGGLAASTDYLWQAKRPECKSRLICFPHGGGAASAYSSWLPHLPGNVELSSIQLPGRQNRAAEPFATSVQEVVSAIVESLAGLLDVPFVFFGHSCGALLAVEVARRLDSIGAPRVQRVVISAQAAPDAFRAAPRLHELGMDRFRSEVLQLGGFDRDLIDDDVLAELLPPVLADFELWERYSFPLRPLLRSPITCLAGSDDPRAPARSMRGWADVTTGKVDIETINGGHFFINEELRTVIGVVCADMG